MWTINQPLKTTASYHPLHHLAQEGVAHSLLLRVLDEVDYGLLVVDALGHVCHANHLARHELATARFITSHDQALLGTTSDFTLRIQFALEAALRGQRRLIQLILDERDLSLAFVPLSHPLESDSPSVLVLLSRQPSSENLAVRMFARAQNLSPSEEAVMLELCKGMTIPDIAKNHGVAVSTVRSQIKALREKTGCASIRRLLQRVHSLPPVVPALRVVSPVPQNAMEFVQP